MAPSRASTLGCFGRKMPQSTQREPSSSDSRGGRSQTWPSAASWRADVWWSGHWSSKLCRRVANDILDVGFILVLQPTLTPGPDLYICTISSGCRRIETLLLSRCCLAAQLLRPTRRLEVGLDMLYDISLGIPPGERWGLDVLGLCNHVAISFVGNVCTLKVVFPYEHGLRR